MPVMDEFRKEREALKHGTPKEKFSYFMDYYKWHVIITVCVIIVAAVFIKQILERRDTVFYVAMINGVDTFEESDPDPFVQYSGIDTGKSAVIYDTSMFIDFNSLDQISIDSAQKFVVYLSAAEMDVVISGGDIIRKYAHNETFYDLREFLTEEQIREYEPYFYYMDNAVVEQINTAQDAFDYEFIPEYPDPRHPENMKQPVPVGIYVTDCPNLTERFYFANGGSGVILSVVKNSARPEITSQYIDFLMKD